LGREGKTIDGQSLFESRHYGMSARHIKNKHNIKYVVKQRTVILNSWKAGLRGLSDTILAPWLHRSRAKTPTNQWTMLGASLVSTGLVYGQWGLGDTAPQGNAEYCSNVISVLSVDKESH
jgi:hypothetical protein